MLTSDPFLDALGLDDKPGKRKVRVLLANMGQEAIKIYDSFTWAPEVEADEQAGIQAVPAEDKHDLNTVLYIRPKFLFFFGLQIFVTKICVGRSKKKIGTLPNTF